MNLSSIKNLLYIFILCFSSLTHSANWRKTCEGIFGAFNPNESIKGTRIDSEMQVIEKIIKGELGSKIVPTHSNLQNDINQIRSWNEPLPNTPPIFQAFLPLGVQFINHQTEFSPEPTAVTLELSSHPFVPLRAKYEYKKKEYSTNVLVHRAALYDNIEQHIVNKSENKWLVGPSARAVIVYLHGGGTKTAHMATALQHGIHWAPFGFELIAIDLSFHGEGPREGESLEENMRSIGAFLQKYIPGNVPLFVYGHSWGGSLALQLMQMTDSDSSFFHPNFRGIISASPAVPTPGDTVQERLETFFKTEEAIYQKSSEMAPPPEAELLDSLLKQDKFGILNEFITLLSIQQLKEITPEHKGENYLKTLVIVGKGDILVYVLREDGFEKLKDLSNIKLMIFDKYPHIDYLNGEEIEVGHLLGDSLTKEHEIYEGYLIEKGTSIDLAEALKFIHETLGLKPSLEESRNNIQGAYSYLYIPWITAFQLYANDLAFRNWTDNLETEDFPELIMTKEDGDIKTKLINDRLKIETEMQNIVKNYFPLQLFSDDIRRMTTVTNKKDLEEIQNSIKSYMNYLPQNYNIHLPHLVSLTSEELEGMQANTEDIKTVTAPKDARAKALEIAVHLFPKQPSSPTFTLATENKKALSPEQLKEKLKNFPYNKDSYPLNPVFPLSLFAQRDIENMRPNFERAKESYERNKEDKDNKEIQLIQKEVNRITASQDPRIILHDIMKLLSEKEISTSHVMKKYKPLLQEHLESLSYMGVGSYQHMSLIKRLYDSIEDLVNQLEELLRTTQSLHQPDPKIPETIRAIVNQYTSFEERITKDSKLLKDFMDNIKTLDLKTLSQTMENFLLKPQDSEKVLSLIKQLQNPSSQDSDVTPSPKEISDFITQHTQINHIHDILNTLNQFLKNNQTLDTLENLSSTLKNQLESFSYLKETTAQNILKTKNLHDLIEDLLTESDPATFTKKAQYVFHQYSYMAPLKRNSKSLIDFMANIENMNSTALFENIKKFLINPQDIEAFLLLVDYFKDELPDNNQGTKKVLSLKESFIVHPLPQNKDTHISLMEYFKEHAPQGMETNEVLIEYFQNLPPQEMEHLQNDAPKRIISLFIIAKTYLNQIQSVIETTKEIAFLNLLKDISEYFSHEDPSKQGIINIINETDLAEKVRLTEQWMGNKNNYKNWVTESIDRITNVISQFSKEDNFLQKIAEDENYSYLPESDKNQLNEFYQQSVSSINKIDDINGIINAENDTERSKLAHQFRLDHYIIWDRSSHKIVEKMNNFIKKANYDKFLKTLEHTDYGYLTEENRSRLINLYQQRTDIIKFIAATHIPQLEDFYRGEDSSPQTEDTDKDHIKTIEEITKIVDELKEHNELLVTLTNRKKQLILDIFDNRDRKRGEPTPQEEVGSSAEPRVKKVISDIEKYIAEVSQNPPETLPEALKEEYNSLNQKFNQLKKIRDELDKLINKNIEPFLDQKLEFTNENIIRIFEENFKSTITKYESAIQDWQNLNTSIERQLLKLTAEGQIGDLVIQNQIRELYGSSFEHIRDGTYRELGNHLANLAEVEHKIMVFESRIAELKRDYYETHPNKAILTTSYHIRPKELFNVDYTDSAKVAEHIQNEHNYDLLQFVLKKYSEMKSLSLPPLPVDMTQQ